jgi:hypothetical protein
MKAITNIIKFIYGWIVWVIAFILSIVFSIITWNWEETLSLDMEIVITQICGKSTWNIMTFNQFKEYEEDNN